MNWLSPTERAKKELETAKSWLNAHFSLSKVYISRVSETHPFVWFGCVMAAVVAGINAHEPQGVELGCHYLIDDPICPFGRIFKRRVANALRRNRASIPTKFICPLVNLPHKFDSHPFTPHEYKDLQRLSNALSQPNRTVNTARFALGTNRVLPCSIL